MIIKRAVKKIGNKVKYRIATNNININHPAAFLFVSPDTGNLGDHLIAIAAKKIIKDQFNMDAIEITIQHYRFDADKIKKYVHENDIIFINGGGFLGSLWMQEENMVIDLIKSFPNNMIIILPQTLYFEYSKNGVEEQKRFKRTVLEHKKLYICLRDMNSYDIILNTICFPKERAYYCPDMSLYLDRRNLTKRNDSITVCIREDKESKINKKDINNIIRSISNNRFNIEYTSTVKDHNISLLERTIETESFFSLIGKTKFVITDRLHCMMFCYLTETPCLAIDNLSHKLSGVYSWIQDCGYIAVVQPEDININDIKEEIANLMTASKLSIDFGSVFVDTFSLLDKEYKGDYNGKN